MSARVTAFKAFLKENQTGTKHLYKNGGLFGKLDVMTRMFKKLSLGHLIELFQKEKNYSRYNLHAIYS